MKTLGFVIGFSLTIGIILIIIMATLKLSNTDGSSKTKYDERQQVARGKGYTYAFYTAAVFAIIPCFIPEEPAIATVVGGAKYFLNNN